MLTLHTSLQWQISGNTKTQGKLLVLPPRNNPRRGWVTFEKLSRNFRKPIQVIRQVKKSTQIKDTLNQTEI